MKKKFILFLFSIFLLYSTKSTAQHYYDQMPQNMKGNSNWILGDWGVNMNTNVPQVFHVPYFGLDTFAHYYYYGSMYQPNVPQRIPWFWWMGADLLHTNVSDPETGALLFNVKSHNCYNRNYQLMPHGYGAIEEWANYVELNAFQYLWDFGHCVTPCINDRNRYYYFSAPQVDSNPGIISYPILRYSIVDMSLDGGLGDIDTLNKNRTLYLCNNYDYITNVLAIAGNNCDTWLLTFVSNEKTYSSKVLVFHITESGIDSIPQLFHMQSDLISPAKFIVSPNRKSLLFFMPKLFCLLHFNPENGVLETSVNKIETRTSDNIEDAAFTPDNRHLIVTSSPEGKSVKSMIVYDFKKGQFSLVKFIPNKAKNAELIYFSVSLRPYGSRIYFNVLKDTAYPPATYIPYNLPHGYSSRLPAGAFSSILNIPASSWSQFDQGPEINLPFVCSSAFPIPVVHPYYPKDTIPDVYVDTLVCTKQPPDIEPFTMIAKPGFVDYIWNDGTLGAIKTVNKAGTYWVYYRGQCNERVDSFIINADLNVSILPADTLVCEQRFPFDLKAGVAEQYLWFNNNTSSQTTIPEPGVYWIQYFKNGCIQHDSIQVISESCPCHVAVPSGFSPNGDGLNDYFKPSIALGCVPTEYVLKIYNRWGQMVYSSFNDFDIGWDGQYKNGVADVDTYFYELKFKSRFLTEPYYKKGEFVLIK